jgi:hypothetical protein
VVLVVFIACVKHYEENFSGISSFDTLSSPMRQALLLLTDERIFKTPREKDLNTELSGVNRCY